MLMTFECYAGASLAATPSFVLADVTGTEQSSRYGVAPSFQQTSDASTVQSIQTQVLQIEKY